MFTRLIDWLIGSRLIFNWTLSACKTVIRDFVYSAPQGSKKLIFTEIGLSQLLSIRTLQSYTPLANWKYIFLFLTTLGKAQNTGTNSIFFLTFELLKI